MKPLHRIIAIALMAITLVAGLTACNKDDAAGYAVNAASLARAGAELHITYDAVAAIVTTRFDIYSAEEQQLLHQVHNSLSALRRAVEQFDAGGATTALVSVDDVSRLYNQARIAYVSARQVIEPHLAKMQPGERAALRRFDEQALALDAAVDALMKTPDGRDISDTVDRVISIAAGGIRLAISAGVI